MNYAFSVTKAGTLEVPIEKIESMDYNKVWLIWARLGITIIYKYKHKQSDNHERHIHYHGMMTSSNKIKYKECMIEGYSIIIDNMQMDKVIKGKKITKQQHYEMVFNYCRHEEIEEKKNQDKRTQELKEAQIYKRVMNAGSPLSQTKLKIQTPLMKVKIEGSF